MSQAVCSELERCQQLEAIFYRSLGQQYGTRLQGGGSEPLYLPGDQDGQESLIVYRADYFNSALHELAHWCIAGADRLALTDYGYWYTTDARDEKAQMEFERVEIRPQAVEWHLALASAVPFQVSLDNLSGLEHRRAPFSARVAAEAIQLLEHGLPERAARLLPDLCIAFGGRVGTITDFREAA